MFRTFVTYKFADGMIAERSFTEGRACLVQLDITDDLLECPAGTFCDQGAEMGRAVAKMFCSFA